MEVNAIGAESDVDEEESDIDVYELDEEEVDVEEKRARENDDAAQGMQKKQAMAEEGRKPEQMWTRIPVQRIPKYTAYPKKKEVINTATQKAV